MRSLTRTSRAQARASVITSILAMCVLTLWPTLAGAQAVASIVGGAPSPDVAVVMLVDAHGRVFCSGALIEPDLVVTAGHCVEDHPDVAVRAQSVDLQWSQRRVARSLVHPAYDALRLEADLALLALDAPLDITPAELTQEVLDDRSIGRALRVVGFGLTDPSDPSSAGERRERVVAVQSLSHDRIRHDESSCDGDSGGPVFVETETGAQIVGVVSGGPSGCAHYGRATRIDVYADWLTLGSRAVTQPAQCSIGRGARMVPGTFLGLFTILAAALRGSRAGSRINRA